MTKPTVGSSPQAESLAAGLRNGDPVAFETFVRMFAPRAMNVARRILGDDADAADAVQDAFISAMRSVHDFRAECQLSTWFHRVVTNAALMRLRLTHRHDVRSLDDLAPSFYTDGHRLGPRPAWAQTPDQIMSDAEQRQMVHQKIAQLPEDSCNVLMLRDIQQESTAHTAMQLGVSESVVKTRLHRARQALRTMLEAELAP